MPGGPEPVPVMFPVLVIPPGMTLPFVTTMPVAPTMRPVLVMPSAIETPPELALPRRMPSTPAVITPELLMPPVKVAMSVGRLGPRRLMPAAGDVIVPELMMLPSKVVTRWTTMAPVAFVWMIVPELLMPPAKCGTFWTIMPLRNPTEIVPELLMPLETVALLMLMPVEPEIWPVLTTTPPIELPLMMRMPFGLSTP